MAGAAADDRLVLAVARGKDIDRPLSLANVTDTGVTPPSEFTIESMIEHELLRVQQRPEQIFNGLPFVRFSIEVLRGCGEFIAARQARQ